MMERKQEEREAFGMRDDGLADKKKDAEEEQEEWKRERETKLPNKDARSESESDAQRGKLGYHRTSRGKESYAGLVTDE